MTYKKLTRTDYATIEEFVRLLGEYEFIVSKLMAAHPTSLPGGWAYDMAISGNTLLNSLDGIKESVDFFAEFDEPIKFLVTFTIDSLNGEVAMESTVRARSAYDALELVKEASRGHSFKVYRNPTPDQDTTWVLVPSP
jgi:hypothetical protein